MRHESHHARDAPDVSKYLAVGLTLALSTLGFLWAGTVLDSWLEMDPVFTLLGAFSGAAAGFYYMIHHLVTVPRRRAAERKGAVERERADRSGREER